nr:TonB-dependent siderophore receptor [uncultured Haemophilus sp.]
MMNTKTFQLTALAMFIASPMTYAEEASQDELSTVDVVASSGNTLTEHNKSYTTSAMKTTTGLTLSPKETPQSVSVITKSTLDERAITSMEDALKTTTGVNVITDAGYYRFQSRGFYIDQIEVDGISSTVRGSSDNTYRDPQSMTDLAIYDHIEVVRGATGLTQSNGEPGGTINAVRKRPTSEFQANGNFVFDTHGKARNMTDISGTIGAGVRGRFISVLENDPTQKDIAKDNKKGTFYGVLDTDIGSNSQLTVGALYQNTNTTPDVFGVPMAPNSADAGLGVDKYMGFDWNRNKNRKWNIFAEFETFFNEDWKLTNKVDYIKSWDVNKFGYVANATNSFTGLVRGNTIGVNNIQRYDNKGDQISLQSNLTGKYELLGRKHDLFVTYTYKRETSDSRWRRIRNSTQFDPYSFNGSEIAEPRWDTDYNDQTFYDHQIYENAVSFGTRFNILENLHLLAGTRYTQWKRVGNTNYDWWNNRADSDPDIHTHLKRSRFIPYAGLTYDLTPHQSVYFNYSSIFKPQSGLGADKKVIDPLLGTNYELGWKTDWYNGKLNTAVALFNITQKNRPIYVVDNNYDGGGYYATTGKVRSRGVDIEISGNLTEDWQLMFGYTFNRSKYLRSESTRYFSGENFSKHTPKHMLRLYTSYNLPIDQKRWTVGAGVSTQSKTESLNGIRQSGYAIWDANIRYEVSKNFAVNLIGKNLTNKRYYENNRVRTAGINNHYGLERTGVLSLDWSFK